MNLAKFKAIPIACFGVCFYLVGFCFELQCDVPLIILALAGLVANLIDIDNHIAPWNQPITKALGLFILASIVSFLMSDDLARSWHMSLMLFPALLIFMLIKQYFNKRNLQFLSITLVLVSLGLSLALFFIALNHNLEQDLGLYPIYASLWVNDLASPILLVPNDIAFISVLTPFSIALILQKTNHYLTALAILSIFLGIVVIALLRSRVALMSEFASLLIMTLLLLKSKHLVLKPVILMLCSGVLVVLFIDGIMNFSIITKIGLFANTRLALWLSAWQMFLDAPIFGHGPHTFVLSYQNYLNAIKLPSWMPTDPRVVPWPHNLYLELLAEQGIIGLISFVWLMHSVFSLTFRLLNVNDELTRIYAAVVLASLSSFSLAAVFELTFLRQWVVIIFFLLMGITCSLYQYKELEHECN